jgi:hypothetical protein
VALDCHCRARHIGPLATIVGLALLLVGCGGGAPSRLSPPVPEEQLDLAQYAGQPCNLLRPDRALRRHLVGPGSAPGDGTGTACRWSAEDSGHPSVTAEASADHGLEPIYQNRASYGSFEPTAIAHYPAVLTTAPGLTPANGVCSTQVGVGDNDLLVVTADYAGLRLPASSDPCLDSNTAAFEIIQQIRSGNP